MSATAQNALAQDAERKQIALRELDEQIQQDIFGWREVESEEYFFGDDGKISKRPCLMLESPDGQRRIFHLQIPRYTEDLNHAFRVVCAVSEKLRWYELTWRPNAAVANFTGDPHDNAVVLLEEAGGDRLKAQCLAIVRAALKMKGVCGEVYFVD